MALQRRRQPQTRALQHAHELGAETFDTTRDAADPADALVVEDAALDAAAHEDQLVQAALGGEVVVPGVLAAGRGGEGGRRGRQHREHGGQVGRGHGGEGDGGHGTDQQRADLAVRRGGVVDGGLRDGLVRRGRQVVLVRVGPARLRLAREELDDLEGHGEDARAQYLQLDARRDVYGRWQVAAGVDDDGRGYFGKGLPQLTSDGGPFYGGEVVVLEEQDQGCRA